MHLVLVVEFVSEGSFWRKPPVHPLYCTFIHTAEQTGTAQIGFLWHESDHKMCFRITSNALQLLMDLQFTGAN